MNEFRSSGTKLLEEGGLEDLQIVLDATYTIKTVYFAWADSWMDVYVASHHLKVYVDDVLCDEFPDFDQSSTWVECQTPLTGSNIKITDTAILYITEVMAYEYEAV